MDKDKSSGLTLKEDENLRWEMSDKDRERIGELRKKLEVARDNREQSHDDFDGMSYTQYINKCEALANTRLKPKLHKWDIQFSTGSLRTKGFAFLSNLLGLNLSPEVQAFNDMDIPINNLGKGLEDIIEKTNEWDGDEEKKMLRLWDLISFGHVFVEEIWDDSYWFDKKLSSPFTGNIKGIDITPHKKKEISKPTRNIIPNLSVYLGDLSKYFIKDQPYIFTVTNMTYQAAEAIYCNFENWKYVPRKIAKNSIAESDRIYDRNWRLLETRDEVVEIIKYQDKYHNEFQIMLNGVPMYPWDMPFPWGYREYNITQQNGKPIRSDFSYGKSILFENKNISELIDEMSKLALLKTAKSFMPAYINLSNQIITQNALMPGKINIGIPVNALQPISEHEASGVTNPEFAMIDSLTRTLDSNTVSQTFTGMQEQGSVTATQVVELQRQARITLGLIVLTASLLEKKCTELRLYNILKNWFDPVDSVVDEARGMIKNKYRTISVNKQIEGKGNGIEVVAVSKDPYTEGQIYDKEEEMSVKTGKPVRIMLLNPEVSTAKLFWKVDVNPKEKKTSELSKLMFNQMVREALELGIPLNMEYVAERFAQVWEEDPSKLIGQQQVPMQEMGEEMGGVNNTPGAPNAEAMTNMTPSLKDVTPPSAGGGMQGLMSN